MLKELNAKNNGFFRPRSFYGKICLNFKLKNIFSCSEVKKLIVSWVDGLPQPLLDYSSSTADEEKLLQSETHRILKNIFKNLGVTNKEADSILSGNSNIE